MLVLLLSFHSYLKYTKFMGHMKDTLPKLKFQTQFWIDFDFHISISLFLITYFYLITQAQGMGKAASEFIQEDLKMEYVYDYMFHLLNEYAKLLTFKPIRPRKAVELCAETMACPAEGVQKKFFMESMENGPTYTSPCTMPHPYDPPSLHAFLQRKENSIKQVELWEKNFWENQNKQI